MLARSFSEPKSGTSALPVTRTGTISAKKPKVPSGLLLATSIIVPIATRWTRMTISSRKTVKFSKSEIDEKIRYYKEQIKELKK